MKLNNESKIYVGYFDDIKYCISEDKKLIKNYMENHRGLSKDSYDIEKEFVTDTDLIIRYSDLIIEEYYGFYIPAIDVILIEIDCTALDELLINTRNNLKMITSILMDDNKEMPIVKHLIDTIQDLSAYTSNKKYQKLYKKSIKTHPVLYCKIDEYNDYVKRYKSRKEMDEQYRSAWIRD